MITCRFKPGLCVTIVVLVVCVALLARFLNKVSFGPLPTHHGDGVFRDLSARWGPFYFPGFSISMPEFNLAREFRAEYKVSCLANIGKECGVFLAIRDPDGSLMHRFSSDLGGFVRLLVKNSRDRTVVDVSGRLGEFIWWGSEGIVALYKLNESFFKSDITEEYVIELLYQPAAEMNDRAGFFYIRSGGGK